MEERKVWRNRIIKRTRRTKTKRSVWRREMRMSLTKRRGGKKRKDGCNFILESALK
jgi:hypothetical protein